MCKVNNNLRFLLRCLDMAGVCPQQSLWSTHLFFQVLLALEVASLHLLGQRRDVVDVLLEPECVLPMLLQCKISEGLPQLREPRSQGLQLLRVDDVVLELHPRVLLDWRRLWDESAAPTRRSAHAVPSSDRLVLAKMSSDFMVGWQGDWSSAAHLTQLNGHHSVGSTFLLCARKPKSLSPTQP